jgi:hypothetical protein
MAFEYFILTSASHIMCPHGARFRHFPSYIPGYLIEGSPMCREGDTFHISCPLGTIEGCSKIQWQRDTTGILFLGKAILTTSSIGILINSKNLRMGSPLWVSFQTTVTLPQFIEALKKLNKKG